MHLRAQKPLKAGNSRYYSNKCMIFFVTRFKSEENVFLVWGIMGMQIP